MIVFLVFLFILYNSLLPQQGLVTLPGIFHEYPIVAVITATVLVYGGLMMFIRPIKDYLTDQNKEEMEVHIGNFTRVYLTRKDLFMGALITCASVFNLFCSSFSVDERVIIVRGVTYTFDKLFLLAFIGWFIVILGSTARIYEKSFKGFRKKDS